MLFPSRSAIAAEASVPRDSLSCSGFTLVELLISMSVMTFLLLVLSEVTGATSRAWRESQSRTDTFQSSRTALEIVARELTPAVVDTRMQFVVAPASIMSAVDPANAAHVASGSPVVLWMAPVGSEGGLCCVGYYLSRDETRQFYRLERLYIPPADSTGALSPYYPKLDGSVTIDPLSANWFTQTWNSKAFDESDPSNSNVVVSSAADGIIALWAQCLDSLGNPIPLVSNSKIHPSSPLYFNSAAYFQMATSTPFDNGASFIYLAKSAQSMKANRLPAAIDLTVVAVDSTIFARGARAPVQTNIYTSDGALDVNASVQAFQTQLQTNHIYNARFFTTRVKLTNGS